MPLRALYDKDLRALPLPYPVTLKLTLKLKSYVLVVSLAFLTGIYVESDTESIKFPSLVDITILDVVEIFNYMSDNLQLMHGQIILTISIKF